ncbi:MAG: hypothetical protein WA364_07420 [Candidatus Nitrosopolaris sp.]
MLLEISVGHINYGQCGATNLNPKVYYTIRSGAVDAALVPAATPPITTTLFFLLVDMCIGIIDIQGNENLQRFGLKLSSFRIPS